ncbi:GIY-YIG nuclease family protein [Saccharicrinis sp. FJH62]|uniref:GIY-YIG nuclease family protein n=1 Tax=Saccharicrinis sp. FJH62 TaxID=3344657 RepID=UPI0035D3EB8C
MEFVVYVLFSPSFKKTYVGFTSDLISRFWSHNKYATKGYTKKFRPWIVVYIEFFHEKSKAMRREKYFKSGIGRNEIKVIIREY